MAFKANNRSRPEKTPAEQRPEILRELMLAYQRGDATAAEQLVRRLSPALLRFLARPLGTRNHAEDLLQECWLRIHRARHTYAPGSPVLPWVFAIARHTRLDGYRRRRRIDVHEVALDPPCVAAATPGPERGDVIELLDALPDSQREVLFMLKVAGMTLEEVARATSSSVGAVKQKAHRGYEKLRRIMRGGPTAE